MTRIQAEQNIGATVIVKSSGVRASLYGVFVDAEVARVVHFPQDLSTYWGRYSLKDLRLANDKGQAT